MIIEPVHEISNNVVCTTSKGAGQPAHKRSQIRVFGLNNILFDKSQDMLWKYIVGIGSDIKL